jgi:hypothetical protein
VETSYEKRLPIPLSWDDHVRFETSTGLHVATGYTRIVIGGRGPYVEFLPSHLIWDSLHIPDQDTGPSNHGKARHPKTLIKSATEGDEQVFGDSSFSLWYTSD